MTNQSDKAWGHMSPDKPMLELPKPIRFYKNKKVELIIKEIEIRTKKQEEKEK